MTHCRWCNLLLFEFQPNSSSIPWTKISYNGMQHKRSYNQTSKMPHYQRGPGVIFPFCSSWACSRPPSPDVKVKALHSFPREDRWLTACCQTDQLALFSCLSSSVSSPVSPPTLRCVVVSAAVRETKREDIERERERKRRLHFFYFYFWSKEKCQYHNPLFIPKLLYLRYYWYHTKYGRLLKVVSFIKREGHKYNGEWTLRRLILLFHCKTSSPNNTSFSYSSGFIRVSLYARTFSCCSKKYF